jgi:hypothetical protein
MGGVKPKIDHLLHRRKRGDCTIVGSAAGANRVLTKSFRTSGRPVENENRSVFAAQISLKNHDFSLSEGRLKHFISSLLTHEATPGLRCEAVKVIVRWRQRPWGKRVKRRFGVVALAFLFALF